MKPEEINRAVAELCGWIPTQTKVEMAGGWELTETRWAYPGKGGGHFNCPNYAGDLNAMHEAEKTLMPFNGPLWADYAANLVFVCFEKDQGSMIHSTAAQRAEAFLRTHGKWIDHD